MAYYCKWCGRKINTQANRGVSFLMKFDYCSRRCEDAAKNNDRKDYKKRKGCNKYLVIIAIGFILFYVFSEANKEEVTTQTTQAQTTKANKPEAAKPKASDEKISGETEKNTRDLIERYYYINENGKYDELENMYAPRLKRYFGKYDVDRVAAMAEAKQYDEKYQVLGKKAQVRWNTLDIKRTDNNNITVSYILDYVLERRNKEKPTEYVLNINLELDANNQIVSICEDVAK